jgi:bifunctional N-acetylglucosamine-1-phosphate-uridyltransferase/glucosamine-1-phosphate-acetyltransferase GlmU-like protein
MFGIILAAGKGTRMNSTLSKVLHTVNDIPMVLITTRKLLSIGSIKRILIVVGDNKNEIENLMIENLSIMDYNKLVFLFQKERLGTGHAVMVCSEYIEQHMDEKSIILFGDLPLIETATIKNIINENATNDCVLAISNSVDPTGCGRIILDNNGIIRGSIEEKDCTAAQRTIKLINAGIYSINNELIVKYINKITNDNAQGEYYLPDILHILLDNNYDITPYYITNNREILNVNTPEQLERANKVST